MTAAPTKALFVTNSAYRLGGLATWLDYLLPALSDRGWDVVLGLVEGPRYHRPERYLEAHPHENRIAIPCRTGTAEGRCRAVLAAIERVRPALVIGVNIPDAYLAVARARARGDDARALMTIHGLEPDLFADVARFREVLDGVAASNRLACRIAVDVGRMEADRVHYTPYGIESPEPPPPDRKPGPVFRVGYVGRLEEFQKRVSDLPAVSAGLDRLGVDHRFVIAGTGPREEALRRRFADGRAAFLGVVPHHDLDGEVYGSVDALLVPSSWETGPLVAWEAMRAGVPVVASRYVGSGLEGALRDGRNSLLFDVGDADGAARALARLAREPGLRRTIRQGGLDLVRERYSRARSVDAWERCLRDVLAAPDRAAAEVEAPSVDTGRLQRLLGRRRAETVRGLLRSTGPDAGPGGEWPHSYGDSSESREAFLRRVGRIDRETGRSG